MKIIGAGSVYVGGIAAWNNKNIKNCYNLANIKSIKVSTTDNWIIIGGLCGINSETIENCYNIGDVSGIYENLTGTKIAAGGIVGFSTQGNIKNCYNAGNINGQNANLIQNAGIIGRNGDGSSGSGSTLQNNYYLNSKTSEASYNYAGNNAYNANTENGKTQTQMKDKSFLLSLGDAYTEDTQKDNYGYPILKWQKDNKK